MKLLSLTLLTVIACGAHAQQTEPLPTPGDSTPLPAIEKPVQDQKEFNQDIDDFEKKISHDVPPPAAPGSDKAAEKARAQMKKQLAESAHEQQPKSAMAKHKEASAAKRAASKKAAAAKKKTKAAKKSAKKKTTE